MGGGEGRVMGLGGEGELGVGVVGWMGGRVGGDRRWGVVWGGGWGGLGWVGVG